MNTLAKILTPKNLNNSLVLVGSFLLFGLLFLLSWASYRGFDFSDESYYHVGYLFHSEIDNPVIFFHRIYNAFFGVFGFTFAQNRVLALFLTLFSSIFLAYSSAIYFNIKERTQLIIFVSVLGFLGHSIFPMSISYNLFSALFSAMLVGLTFLYLKKGKFISIFLIGLFSMLLITNKFTNLSFLFFFFPIILFLDYFENKRRLFFYIKSVSIFLLGFIITLFFLFHSFSELNASFSSFVYGLSLSTGHSLASMLTKIVTDITGLFFLVKYLLPTLIVGVFLKWKKNIPYSMKLITLTGIVNILALVLINKGFYGRTSIYIFFFYLIFITIFIFLFFQKKGNTKKTLLYFVLILIPFASSIGTNNSLFVQFTFYGNLFAVGLFLLFSRLENTYLRYFLIIISLVISTFNISYNKIYNPYRINTNLLQQTEEIKNIPYLAGLKVDVETKQQINQLLALKKQTTSHIFLTSRQLGISLITEKEPLLFTWIDGSSFHLISKLLQQKENKLSDDLLFVVPSQHTNKIIPQLLKVKALNFESNYKIIDNIENSKDTLIIYGKR